MQDAEAVSKMTSAVQGSAEAARQLNVDLSDTKLQETMVAMGYHGVYEALDDASKATVRYNAIVAQSQGALEGVGAAAKALEDNDFAGWQNAWNASLNNFKAVMGSYILPYVTEAYKLGTKIVETLTRSIDRQGKVNTHAERAARIFGAINRVLSVVYNAGKKVVDFIGGADNAVQLLMVTLGTLMGLKLVDYIGKIGTALAGVNIWVVLLVAVALGLFIVIQDFYNFMNGKDSVLGRFFEMKGIDPDKVRQKISDFVDKTKEKIEEFKKKAGEFKDALAGMFRQKGEELKDEYGPRLEKMLDTVGPIVEQFETLGNNLKELGENAWPYIEPFLNGLLAFFDTLAKIDLEIEFSKIEGTVKALEPLLAMFNSLIEAANLALKGDSEGADKKLEEAWGHLVEVGEVISKQIFETISNILGLLPDEALKWGSGMIENLRKGIDSGIDKLRAKVLEVLDALGPIGTAIKWLAGVDEEDAQGAGSTLHVDAAGVERGGSNGKAGARKPKSGWATRRTMEDIQKLAGSSSPAVDTVNNFDRSGNTLNSSPTFNSTINNTFYSTDQQTISNGMQATNNVAREWDDYTRQLSREATAVGW